jgi:phage-related protein
VADERRDLYWIASAREDLRALPDDVKDVIGQALLDAQYGDKHPEAKPLQGFGGAGVLEIVEDFDGDTYRAVYTVKLRSGVYVLHVFQKKATRGIRTPKHEIDLIKTRLRIAEAQDAIRLHGIQ